MLQCKYLQVVDRIHDSPFHQGYVQQLYSSLASRLCTYCLPLHASRQTVQRITIAITQSVTQRNSSVQVLSLLREP
jgi:hypothetical protein